MFKNKVKRFSRKKTFQGYCFDAVRDDVLWPNGKRIKRDLILHPGITVIVPVLDARHLVLIRQYRYGAGEVLWEIPAGTMDPHESPLACAKREIQEEIGYKASRWKKMISFYPCPGFSTEIIHAFEAPGLVKTQTALEEDEILEAHVFSLKEVQRMLVSKKIRDAKSLVPLFYFLKEKKAL